VYPRHTVKAIPFFLAASVVALTFGCKKGQENANAGSGGGAANAPAAEMPKLNPLAILGDFEGEIDAVNTENRPGATPTAFSVLVKGGKIRFAIPPKVQDKEKRSAAQMFGEASYVIFDPTLKKYSIVSDPKQSAMVMDLNNPMANQFSGEHPPRERAAGVSERPPPKVTKTGKLDTVAGHKCEIWDVVDEKNRGSLCVAEEGASWFHLPTTFVPGEHAWMSELLDGKHLPLRMIELKEDGMTETKRIEVTKLDKRSLPQSDFEVPPGYKVIDLAQMFAGMAGMAGGMDGGMPWMRNRKQIPSH
jgi:hypothetical protein